MANNPLDANEFSFYLSFEHDGYPDEYRIAEPVSWDSANFIEQQESKRYARSIDFGAVEKLTFIDAYGIDTGVEQVINNLGDVSTHLDYGLQWLLQGYKDFGFEFKVSFIIKKSGLEFNRQQLDFTDKGITDGYTFVTTKLIQKNKVANLKRRLDDKFNLFGTVNAKNETITPAPTVDFLLKATPVRNTSTFNGNGTSVSAFALTAPNNAGTGLQEANFGANNSNKIIDYGINNTLSFLSPRYATVLATDVDGNQWQVPNDSLSFTFIQAQNDLSDVQIEISNVVGSSFANFTSALFPTTNILTGSGYAKLLVVVGNDLETEPFTVYELWDRDFNLVLVDNSSQPLPTSFSLTIPVVERGQRIYVYFAVDTTATFNNFNNPSASASVSVVLNNIDIQITATETALNTIVKGVRWIDLLKQSSKFTSDIPVNAELFELGGAHYDNLFFNKRCISGFADNFNVTPKICFESVEEVNCDYEPDEDEIFVSHQSSFYVNEEIGVFNIIPDEDFTIDENDRCQINKFKYKYKKYEQDRTTKGTSEAIHTESEWRFLNENVENLKEVSVEQVRDPFAIQSAVNLEIKQPTTSTSDDDTLYCVNITSLAPSSFNEFGARLLMRIADGKLEILNRDSNGDSNDVVINWTILGFQVGQAFQITFGENTGNYTVFAMTTTVLTLTPIAFTPTFEGDGFVRFKYYYTNVLYTSRTTQGFISNPNDMQNAQYSIKRNMGYFGEYFGSCLLYSKKDIPNAYFKSNGAFTSQLTTEVNPVTEDATILHSDLPNPLTSARMLNLTCVAEFEDVLAYLEAYKVNRGFVRCLDSKGRVLKGFVQKLDHLWSENKLKLVLEEKFETQYLILTYADGVLTVNDAQYNLSGIENWYRFDNDFIKLYDEQNRPLSNYYRYDYVKLNGVIYDSKEELSVALESL